MFNAACALEYIGSHNSFKCDCGGDLVEGTGSSALLQSTKVKEGVSQSIKTTLDIAFAGMFISLVSVHIVKKMLDSETVIGTIVSPITV